MKLLTILIIAGSLQTVSCQRLNKNKSNQASINNIDVYLRIGDSQESGGTATQDSTFPLKYNSVLKNTIIYFKPDRTSSANGAWLNVSDSNPTINYFSGYNPIQSVSPPYAVGPAVSFSYSIDSAFKKRVGIIKCALGGTLTSGEWAAGGSMYNFFLPYSYTPGLSSLSAKTVTVKAVIIRLGTNDCALSYNDATFKTAIQNLVKNIRSYTGLPSLPVYWVQIKSDLYLEPTGNHTQSSVNAARAALTACATVGDPAYISNFTLLNYDSDTTLSDGIHYNQNSCIRQGNYEAGLMINLGE